MYTYTWYQWLAFFYLYCFLGWIFESSYVSIKQGHFVNRGFLRLPMLPLYGSGAVMMLWVSIPVQDSLVLTWCSGVVGATVLEYVTGYVMELLFKVRYWDYSNQKFNVHGYICLSSSIAWGFLTIFMTHLIHRPIERGILSMPLLWNLCFVIVVTVAFVYDAVICTREAFAFGKSLEAVKKLRRELDSLQVQAALLKMEAEDRLLEAGLGLKDQLDLRYDKAAALTGMGLEELKTRAGSKLESLKDLTAVNLEELKARADGKLDGLKDLSSVSLENLRGKSPQQLASLLKEKEASLTALLSSHLSFCKNLFRSNPSISSRLYEQEFKALKEYLNRMGDGKKH